MDLAIAGRHALVFGGSRGMGRACARQLALDGVRVTIAARTASTLQATALAVTEETGTQLQWVVADITTAAGRDAALQACPSPDILVTNGDGRPPGDFRDWTEQRWHDALNAMMLAPIEMIRRTVDPMIERGFGRIVNIVSRSAKTPQAELGLSNGARAALVGFVAGLARQTVRRNVTINNILPGAFATDAQRHHVQALAKSGGKPFEQLWRERSQANPAGRFGRAEEVGALCAYLCSAQAAYLTGQSLLIDGGACPGTF